MASIHLLGGKKRLLTIQVTDLVHLQALVPWARFLRRHARATVALMTSVGLLVFLFTHFHAKLHAGRSAQDSAGQANGEAVGVVWHRMLFFTRQINLMGALLAIHYPAQGVCV